MTSRRTWPKADLLQQRRLALGLFAAADAPSHPPEWFIASDIDCSAKKLLCFMPSSSLKCFHPGVVQ